VLLPLNSKHSFSLLFRSAFINSISLCFSIILYPFKYLLFKTSLILPLFIKVPVANQ
jgi:hypothetical protein